VAEGNTLGTPAAVRFCLIRFYEMKRGNTMQETTLPKGSSKKASPNSLEQATTYQIDGRSFVVQPVFKEDGSNTLGDVLLRLMQSDFEKI
jgi:hypothetical protein